MRRVTNAQIKDAVHENADGYIEDVIDALEDALQGIAHDTCVDLLMDDEYPGDDDYNALLNRVRLAARMHVTAVLRAGGR